MEAVAGEMRFVFTKEHNRRKPLSREVEYRGYLVQARSQDRANHDNA
jgi:hypothetical protein